MKVAIVRTRMPCNVDESRLRLRISTCLVSTAFSGVWLTNRSLHLHHDHYSNYAWFLMNRGFDWVDSGLSLYSRFCYLMLWSPAFSFYLRAISWMRDQLEIAWQVHRNRLRKASPSISKHGTICSATTQFSHLTNGHWSGFSPSLLRTRIWPEDLVGNRSIYPVSASRWRWLGSVWSNFLWKYLFGIN